MTREEFRSTKFHAGMQAMYQGNKYDVVSVNFEEDLFGLGDDGCDDSADLMWARCENVELKTE